MPISLSAELAKGGAADEMPLVVKGIVDQHLEATYQTALNASSDTDSLSASQVEWIASRLIPVVYVALLLIVKTNLGSTT
ncbi:MULTISPECIES: hypothetical protein [unclassified Brevundimonas]|uniref:hypothetical protein n=1 Tax=unclassified Brevundimonas TaxID=2622653 RepID=UPI0025C45B8C|nr:MULTISPECIES: hypothetical protein [unclassified Brevundimonas]